ncbi:macro domain-containing protein [Leptolyngbya sp. FACHB-321]|uniref:macro domain-containing protein n=1 Tax=Leptolyngbya sp. FACHB-321 TaxID=2692807 RepID=UPI00168577BA|nr:macro domain-containing protein [Leptolyngbya sp. FACHB-321]MBD2036970.1 macro domain-containing protein [Leptolyngbya sp. FACHB-321]
MPLVIAELIMKIAPELLQLFVSVIVPVAGQLLKFTLPRLARIPLYLRLLWTIYQDDELNAEARKYLTSVLLVLGSILTFIVYSYIPWTGVPIVGALTTPIAGMVAAVVSLVSLDFLVAANRDYLVSKYPEEVGLISRDIDDLTALIGTKAWKETIQQTQALLDRIKESVDPNGKYDDVLSALMNALISYLADPESDPSLPPDEINRRIVTEGLPPVAKIGGSIAEGLVGGAIAGAATQGITTATFVQAGFLTSIKAAIGMGSGIAVAPTAFIGLTVALPIALTAITGVGIIYGAKTLRDEGEKRKLSAFLADVLISALPMAWIDGNFSMAEQDVFEKLLLNSAINESDQRRIREVMKQQTTLEEVLNKGLLKEENPQKAKMKYRLLLCTAWEIAKADGSITSDEINLHNRIAKFVNIAEEEVHEIRRLVLLKSGIDLHDRISVVQGHITQQSVDAIVNSTNKNLLPSNKIGWLPLPKDNRKIDTVVHDAAGSELQKECQSLNGCDVGEAKLTKGYKLPSQWVIHTVVPTLGVSDRGEHELLAQCYRSCLAVAHQQSVRTLAFPALGTGRGKFPVDQAAKIAISEVQQFLNTHFSIEQVKIVCLDEHTYQVYVETIKQVLGSSSTKLLSPVSNEAVAV